MEQGRQTREGKWEVGLWDRRLLERLRIGNNKIIIQLLRNSVRPS